MKPSEALAAIKMLRDAINDVPDPTLWTNQVVAHLDRAADEIEFPTTLRRRKALEEAEKE